MKLCQKEYRKKVTQRKLRDLKSLNKMGKFLVKTLFPLLKQSWKN